MNLESALAAFATAAALVSDSANKVMPSVLSEAQKFSQSILRESGSVASILAKQNSVVASQIVTEGGLLQAGAIKCPRPIQLAPDSAQTPTVDSLRYECVLETIYGHVPFVAGLRECPELPLGTLGVAGLGAMAAPGAVAGSVLGAMGVEDNGLIAGTFAAKKKIPTCSRLRSGITTTTTTTTWSDGIG